MCEHENNKLIREEYFIGTDGMVMSNVYQCLDCDTIGVQEWVVPDNIEWENEEATQFRAQHKRLFKTKSFHIPEELSSKEKQKKLDELERE